MTATDATPTDQELAAQPVAYWTGLAHRELLAYVRRELAALGVTQPQIWMLRHLSPNDLAADGEGLTVAELTALTAHHLEPEDDLAADAEDLLGRGWVTRDAAGRLRITGPGDQARADIRAGAPAWRARMHEGVDDADYVTTLRVLRRMLRNVGSEVA